MSLQLMKERIKNTGLTPRDEKIINARRILQSDFKNDPQYNQNIVLYDTDQAVNIKIYDEKYTNSYGIIVKFQTQYEDMINVGTILHDIKLNEYWICLESAFVGEIHYEGKLAKCNRTIKWQESNGNLYEIPIVNRNASQYNNGESTNSAITLASDQLFLYTQLNIHTVSLDHGIKFFIDENIEKPTVYEITRPDTIDYSYMGIGMMTMVVTECAYSPSKEELEYGVCGYYSPAILPEPPKQDETTVLFASIIGNTNLKCGIAKKYSVAFTDKDGNEVKDCDFKWNVISSFDIEQTINDSTIVLKVEDESYIGDSILLQIIVNHMIITETTIKIIDIV